ncbi:MAG TPA: UDP-N-acetylmuramoyl-L-alanine--D-glutamate ligase [Steroidobacteraceae bacterium]|jgi:UDP-N-acetylmuramoylalanine--D-glutamate ligase
MSARSVNPLRAVVVGLGRTGLSVARFLLAQGTRVAVTDSRAAPPELSALQALGAPVVVRTGGFDAALLQQADLVVVSPGVPLSGPFFEAARARGLSIVGDIELFARAARAPVVGITGTNGKSTVTSLLAQMAARSGVEMRAGGNLGPPALDLLASGVKLYILELSSFQLETTESLALAAAAVLNVSSDHLDRYPSLQAYAAAKARIYARCDVAVINLDDPLVAAMPGAGQRQLSFSLRADVGADYALMRRAHGDWWLTRRAELLLACAELRLSGLHNAANALAALALAEALALPRAACLEVLREFPGLPHRTQWVADIGGVRYINDSKGTNVGATLAAVGGMQGPLIVIAGGDGKGQDFAPLRAAFADKVRAVVLIGRDAGALASALQGVSELHFAADLDAAVEQAARLARAGDRVLLSPACSSLDMFRDYAQRGELFAAAVQRRSA